MLFLRIACTAISAVCLGALIPLGAILGWTYAILCGVSAFLFFVLMLLCKQAQEAQEDKSRTLPPDNETSEEKK